MKDSMERAGLQMGVSNKAVPLSALIKLCYRETSPKTSRESEAIQEGTGVASGFWGRISEKRCCGST